MDFFLYMLINDLLPQIIPEYITFSGSISLNIEPFCHEFLIAQLLIYGKSC